MRIAVTYQNGEVYQHFGHTELFRIYDVENGRVVHKMTIRPTNAGHEAMAKVLQKAGADLLICGGIGDGAQRAVHLRHRPHSESAGMVGGHRTAMQGVRHRTGTHHSQRRGLPTGVLHAEGHVAASGTGVDGAAGGRQGVRYLGERPLAMLVRSAPRVCAFPG